MKRLERLNRYGIVACLIATSATVLWVGVTRRSGQAINMWWNGSIGPTTQDHSILEGRLTGPLLEKYTYQERIKTVIDENQLPELPHLLQEIGLGDRLQDFYRKSVFETKYLFTMNDMDLRLLGLSPAELGRVKDKLTELRVEKEVTVERIHPLLEKRNTLTYGRLFLDRSVSSFEFYLASFGPPAPVDEATLVWAEPRNACRPPVRASRRPRADGGAVNVSEDLLFVLAVRGECSFVDKANNVAMGKAAALVLVNTGDDAEELFRVSATLGGKNNGSEDPKGPRQMATVLVRGSALLSISKALEWGPVKARLVPLECKPGRAACEALLPEERDSDLQVDSGLISLAQPGHLLSPGLDETFDFLSATFGSMLPRGQIPIIPSIPGDACTPLQDSTVGVGVTEAFGGGSAFIVRRGGCSFGQKAKHVQDAGGSVIVVADNSLGVLQNFGAQDSTAKELYIPGILVTAKAGDTITAAATPAAAAAGNTPPNVPFIPEEATLPAAATGGTNRDGPRAGSHAHHGALVSFHPDNGVGREWANLGQVPWPEDLLETRVLARQLQAAHADSPCRLHWIRDKVRETWGADTDDLRTRAAVASSPTPPRGDSEKHPAAGVEEL